MLELPPDFFSKQLLDVKNLKPIIFSYSLNELDRFLKCLKQACNDYAVSSEEDRKQFQDRIARIEQRVIKFSSRQTNKNEDHHVQSLGMVKYNYTSNGSLKSWSGKGRMPKVIKIALESGMKLDDFLAKN